MDPVVEGVWISWLTTMSDCQARCSCTAGREIAERESATLERCHQQEHLTIHITHVEI